MNDQIFKQMTSENELQFMLSLAVERSHKIMTKSIEEDVDPLEAYKAINEDINKIVAYWKKRA